MDLVTEHFAWSEMLRTDQRSPEILAAQANPPAEIRGNVERLCRNLLEPVRALVGRLHVNSGYRSPPLNYAIGGSKTSRHMAGLAADLVPLDCGLVEAFERIAAADPWPLDQLIFEFGRWVHVGATFPDVRPRHQLLMIFDAGCYEPWNPTDPRVTALRRSP